MPVNVFTLGNANVSVLTDALVLKEFMSTMKIGIRYTMHITEKRTVITVFCVCVRFITAAPPCCEKPRTG